MLCLVFGLLTGTVSAEKFAKAEENNIEQFSFAQELSAEDVCELLQVNETVECVNVFNDEVYFIDGHALYLYDSLFSAYKI